jgi:hypothetical protein
MIAAILSPMSRPSDRIPAAPQRWPGNQPPGIAAPKSMIFMVRRKGPEGKPLLGGEKVYKLDR